MPTGAIYHAASGLIQQTVSPPLAKPEQLAALESQGLKQILIPDGKNGSTGMIDLATGKYADFQAQGEPIPNVMVQLAAALVNAGVVPATAFHPATVVEVDAMLEPHGM